MFEAAAVTETNLKLFRRGLWSFLLLAPVGLKMGVMVTVGGDEGGAGVVGPPPTAGVMASISSWQMGFLVLIIVLR